jgi:hypothetical protein
MFAGLGIAMSRSAALFRAILSASFDFFGVVIIDDETIDNDT